MIDARTEWTMRVHFKKASASGSEVTYTVESATVDYLEVSHHDARGRRGDASIHTLQTERIEASGRTLDGKACNLVLVVDHSAKRYWTEVGGFKLEDVPRSGRVLIEITDANGTRSVSEPATGDHNVIVPVRFEARYPDDDPKYLKGAYDANVEPPPGVDLSYETVGGMVEWSLYRGACPDVEQACFADAEWALSTCAGIHQNLHQLDCDLARINSECFALEIPPLVDGEPLPSPLSPRDCVSVLCTTADSAPVNEPALDALMECLAEYRKTRSDCDDLCP